MEDELYHHGIKGQKHGNRRYQYKDGTLTPLGRQRLGLGPPREKNSGKKGLFGKPKNKAEKERKSAKGKNEDKSEEAVKSKSKDYKDMSDEELKKQTERLNLESNYLAAYSRINPAKVAKGESFAKKFMNEAIKPALVEVGKRQLQNILNNKIDSLTKKKVAPDEMELLKKAYNKIDLERNISKAKKEIAVNEDWFRTRSSRRS